MPEILIKPLVADDLSVLDEHFVRHIAESGRNDIHFAPFAPSDEEGPKGVDKSTYQLPLSTPNWRRWWCAWLAEEGRIIGHVDIKGDSLRTGLHRCVLGIGIEQGYRGQGLGRRLMQTAIDFATAEPSLDWLDLMVFAHNENARALYRDMGFEEVGIHIDRFRIEGESLDDVTMTLDVSE